MKRLPVLPVLIAGLLGSVAVGQDPPADGVRLLQRMQQALGGADKLMAIRDYEWSIVAKTYARDTGQYLGDGRRTIRFVRPNHFRFDQVISMGEVKMYFDGEKGWEITPDKGYQELVGGELRFAQGELAGFYLKVWLADRDPSYTVALSAANVIRIAHKNGSSRDITVDPQSGLPVRTAGVSISNPDAPVAAYAEVKEWREVNGVKLPQRILNHHSGVLVADIVTTEIKINSGLKPADLAAPPAKPAALPKANL